MNYAFSQGMGNVSYKYNADKLLKMKTENEIIQHVFAFSFKFYSYPSFH